MDKNSGVAAVVLSSVEEFSKLIFQSFWGNRIANSHTFSFGRGRG